MKYAVYTNPQSEGEKPARFRALRASYAAALSCGAKGKLVIVDDAEWDEYAKRGDIELMEAERATKLMQKNEPGARPIFAPLADVADAALLHKQLGFPPVRILLRLTEDVTGHAEEHLRMLTQAERDGVREYQGIEIGVPAVAEPAPKQVTAEQTGGIDWAARDRDRKRPHHARGIGSKRAVVVQTVEAVTEGEDLDAWADVFDNMAGA